MLKSFKSFTDAVAPIKTFRSVKVVSNPTRGDIVARDEPKSAKGSSMIGAFIAQISTMTVHVLHGEPKPTLCMDQRLLTSKRQLHMSASLDSTQTNTSSMHRIVINT